MIFLFTGVSYNYLFYVFIGKKTLNKTLFTEFIWAHSNDKILSLICFYSFKFAKEKKENRGSNRGVFLSWMKQCLIGDVYSVQWSSHVFQNT